jgi:hypothetical protein
MRKKEIYGKEDGINKFDEEFVSKGILSLVSPLCYFFNASFLVRGK